MRYCLKKRQESFESESFDSRVFPPTSVSLGSLVHLEIYIELIVDTESPTDTERANRASWTAIRIMNKHRARDNSVCPFDSYLLPFNPSLRCNYISFPYIERKTGCGIDKKDLPIIISLPP